MAAVVKFFCTHSAQNVRPVRRSTVGRLLGQRHRRLHCCTSFIVAANQHVKVYTLVLFMYLLLYCNMTCCCTDRLRWAGVWFIINLACVSSRARRCYGYLLRIRPRIKNLPCLDNALLLLAVLQCTIEWNNLTVNRRCCPYQDLQLEDLWNCCPL